MRSFYHIYVSAVLAECIHCSLALELPMSPDLAEWDSTSIIWRPGLRRSKATSNIFISCRILNMLRSMLSFAKVVHLDFWRIRIIWGRMWCQRYLFYRRLLRAALLVGWGLGILGWQTKKGRALGVVFGCWVVRGGWLCSQLFELSEVLGEGAWRI